MKKLKNLIREMREERGLSRNQLAAKVGCHPNQIVKLERSERRLTDKWIYRLARALRCSPSDLLESPDRLSPQALIVAKVFDSMSDEAKEGFLKGFVPAAWRSERHRGPTEH